MNKRFVCRKESFGGLIYDKKYFSYYFVDEYGFEIISRVNSLGVKATINYYKEKEEEACEDVIEYIDALRESKIINNEDDLDGEIISNRYTLKSLGAPTKVYLTVTDLCNLQCKHCFGDFGVGNEMTLEQISYILEQLKEIGVLEISITGGEPFYHSDIFSIIEMIIEKGFILQITTNGTLVTDEFIKTFKRYGDKCFRLSISLDGISEIHDMIRGEGTYDRVMDNIKKLQNNNIDFGFNTVINNLNIDTFGEFLNTLYNKKIYKGSYSLIKPLGRARDSELNLIDINENSWRNKIRLVKRLVEDFAKETQTNQYFNGRTILSNKKEVFSHDSIKSELGIERCGAGVYVSTILSNGNLSPCVFLNDALNKRSIEHESIFEKDFKSIWDNNEQFIFARNLKSHLMCTDCDYNTKKYCSGGCPAIADVYFDDITTPDPYCMRHDISN